MGNETSASTPTTQIDPKSTATNIVQGIQDKAQGKRPGAPDPKKNGEAQPPVDPNAGKEKYVVDGKEYWLTTDQAKAYAQKGIAFEPKVSQLGHLQNEVNQLLRDLQDPSIAIKKLKYAPKAVIEAALNSGQMGPDVEEFIGNWYWKNVVERERMTPEQREIADIRKKNQEFESREAFARDMAIKQENQRRIDMAMSQIKAQISESMKASGLPTYDTPLGAMMARRVADVMRLGYFQRQTITPTQAIEKVKDEMKQIQSAYYDILDEDTLVKELGEVNAKKIQKYFLKVAKEAEKQIPDNGKVRSTPKGERKTISSDDMAEYLAELKRNNAPTKFK